MDEAMTWSELASMTSSATMGLKVLVRTGGDDVPIVGVLDWDDERIVLEGGHLA